MRFFNAAQRSYENVAKGMMRTPTSRVGNKAIIGGNMCSWERGKVGQWHWGRE